MAEITSDLENLDLALGDLEGSIAGTQAVTAAFTAELAGVNTVLAATTSQATGFTRSVGTSLRTAFDALVFDGARLTDVLRGLSLSIADSALDAVLKPVTNQLGNLLGGGLQNLMQGMLPFENGAAFSSGRVQAFAKGGVISQATTFPMRGGTGLMGEAGPRRWVDQRHHEYQHAGCGRISALTQPDCCAVSAGIATRRAQSLNLTGGGYELSRGSVSDGIAFRISGWARAAH